MAVFSNSFTGSVAIPDGNPTGITNVLAISGVPTAVFLREIRVTLNIFHDDIQEISIFLIDPDGNQIELSTGNGSFFNNYTDTVFVDSAATSITAGSAPFTGSFRPEQALSTLYPGAINGNWRVKVVDAFSSLNLGLLQNWSIELSFGEASRSIVPSAANESRSTVSASPDGRFSVSWNDNTNLNGNVSNLIFGANGTTISAALGVGQNLPEFSAATAFLQNGSHALAYVRNNNGAVEIRLKIDSGPEFFTSVGIFTSVLAGDQVSPMLAALSDGNLVVAYVDVTTNTLQGRIFNTTTNTFGAAVTLTAAGQTLAASPNPELQPAELIALRDGGFTVSYLKTNGQADLRVFDNSAANGSSTTSIAYNGVHAVPAIVQLANGQIMTVGFDQGFGVINTAIYSVAGAILGGQPQFFTLSNAPGAQFHNLRASALPDGRVIVVGSSLVEGAVVGSDIWGQVINATGTLDGAAFRINGDNLAGAQSAPDIATLADGRVVITWTDHNINNGDIMQQIIDLRTTAVNLVGIGSLNEQWVGTRFIDTMDGGLGNDILDGGAGIDLLTGGAGNDVFVLDELNDTIVEDFNAGTDTIRSGQITTFMINPNVENLELLAGGVTGWGTFRDNVMTGNALANTFVAGPGADTVSGFDGDDVLIGDFGSDILNGGNNNDQLWGGDDSDTLNGGDGDDVLIGGAGTNILTGGLGDDVYIVTSATDTLTEAVGAGTGNDTAWIFATGMTLANNIEVAVLIGVATSLTGNGGDETLLGNGGLASTINGGGGVDTLWGSTFGDTLSGDAGTDTLIGLGGPDIFGFTTFGSGFDVVNDFSGIHGGQLDRIDLRGLGVANFAALSLTQAGVGTTVNFGVDGILLWNITATNLQAGDFILV